MGGTNDAADLLNRIRDGVAGNGAHGIRITADYSPPDPLLPVKPVRKPTTPSKDRNAPEPDPYIRSEAAEGPYVVLDTYQSQANRIEQALLPLTEEGSDPWLPSAVLDIPGLPWPVTDLDAPHRVADAYFRDSADADGTPFKDTPLGRALIDAAQVRGGSLTELYRHVPVSVALGLWDSHSGRKAGAKIHTSYNSRVIAFDPRPVANAGLRDDPILRGTQYVKETDDGLQVVGKGTSGTKRISEVGLGPVPHETAYDGVLIDSAQRTSWIGFTSLRGLRFGGVSKAEETAIRTVLASILLYGDRAAFGSAVWLRSNCELLMDDEQLVLRGSRGEDQSFECDEETAREVLRLAITEAEGLGVKFAPATRLVPVGSLQRLVDNELAGRVEEPEV